MFTPNRNSDAESRVKRAIKSFKRYNERYTRNDQKDRYLEVNGITSSHPLFHLCYENVCLTIEDIKMSYTIAGEEHAGDGAMKSIQKKIEVNKLSVWMISLPTSTFRLYEHQISDGHIYEKQCSD